MERRQQVAQQLKALMERHHLTPADIEKKTEVDGRPPVSAVTVRRILKSEARTEPEPTTLRRIAEAVGERFTVAFAETEMEVQLDVSQKAGKYHLRFIGPPAPEGLEAELRKVLEKYEKKLPKPAPLKK